MALPQTPRFGIPRAWLGITAALLVAAAPAWADLSTKTATQNDITISYRSDPNGPVQTYILGSFQTILENYDVSSGDYAHMWSRFTVNTTGPDAPPASFFNNVSLHWYQQVVSLPVNDPATYKGYYVAGSTFLNEPATLPITDPPNGGWDYMYNDGSNRTQPNASYGPVFIDNKPYYWTSLAEQYLTDTVTNTVMSQPGVQYTTEDFPADRSGNNGKGAEFATYLVAQATNYDPLDPMGLLPGQMLVLGGFQWYDDVSDIEIESTFAGARPNDVSSIDTALANGGFPAWNSQTYSGWEAVSNELIDVAVPLPATAWMGGSTLALLGAIAWRRRVAYARRRAD
jgi:hypothetical protein